MRSVASTVAAILLAVAGYASAAPAQQAALVEAQPAVGGNLRLDALAGKARAVLEANCARCHQFGLPGSQPVPTTLGNILDLAALARNSSLVRPGNPDASPLYLRMLLRHQPQDVYGAGGAPGAKEIEAVRDWIAELTPEVRTCKDRQPLASDQLAQAMAGWLDQVGAAVAQDTRFISLAPVANDCVGDAELAAYRQAIQKLIASLSWSPLPPRIEAVGDSLALFAFRLTDAGWVPAHWETLMRAEPSGTALGVPAALAKATGTERPVIRGDWLATVAGRPPLYYELLGLPSTLGEAGRLIGIDIEQSWRGAKGKRAALRSGAATTGPRVVERLQADRGALWLAHELVTGSDNADPFERPLGPTAGPSGAAPFKQSLTRAIFTLPNGFFGFASFDADGRRLDKLPAASRDYPSLHGAAAGQACMSCHRAGLRPVKDQLREYALSDKHSWPGEVKDAVLAMHVPPQEFERLQDDDGYKHRRAVVQSGIDPDGHGGGGELVTALARRYEQSVDLARAAAELGTDPKSLAGRLRQLSGDAQPLGLRLMQGVLSRTEAEALLAIMARPDTSGSPVATGTSISAADDLPSAPPELLLWSDKAIYKAGDLATLNVKSSVDCHLTLIGIDKAGKATVLFPNDFEMENLLSAGRHLRIPAANAAYQLRLKDPGSETMVALCQTAAKVPAGIEHDFERQRFTLLGNWRSFVAASYTTTGEEKQSPQNTNRRRGAQSKSEQKRPELELRTAIRIVVE